MSTSALDGWAELASLDPTIDKSVNSLLTVPADNTSPNNAFAYAWPGAVGNTFGDAHFQDSQNHVFGLSPSVTDIGPLTSFHPLQDGPSPWPVSFDNTRLSSDASSAAVSSDTATTTSNLDTPNDLNGLQHGSVLGSKSFLASFGAFARAPDSSTHDQSSPSAPINADLLGYHNNVAANHASHLSDLVKASAIIGSGHPGPRSLASSLSRSVMSATAYSQPDPTTSPPHPDAERLSIQQRRRLSLQEQKQRADTATAFDVSFGQRQRTYSAPGPPYLSSDTGNSQVSRARRAPTVSSDGNVLPFGPLPKIESSADEWTDTLLANSHDLVFVLSLKGTVLFISPSVERILGFAPEEIVGRPLIDLSHPADVGPCSRELKEAISLPEELDAQGSYTVKGNRVDLILRMACKSGDFCLIETTGKVSVDPPKQRKVIVCSGRPHPIPMLPWKDVCGDLMTSELSAWLKISHNGIFLGSTGPINQILGIEDVNLLGRHICDLPMVSNSTDLLEALRCGRSISVQDHYDGSPNKAPVKLTVYPWTSGGRSNALAFVHVQQQPLASAPLVAPVSAQPTSPNKRKADFDATASSALRDGAGALSGSSLHPDGSSVPAMSAIDAAATVFSELTGFHNGSWLIEMQKLHNTNRRLRYQLSTLRKQSPCNVSKPIC